MICIDAKGIRCISLNIKRGPFSKVNIIYNNGNGTITTDSNMTERDIDSDLKEQGEGGVKSKFGQNAIGSARAQGSECGRTHSLPLPAAVAASRILRRSRRLLNHQQNLDRKNSRRNNGLLEEEMCDVNRNDPMSRLTNFEEFEMHLDPVSQELFMGCLDMQRKVPPQKYWNPLELEPEPEPSSDVAVAVAMEPPSNMNCVVSSISESESESGESSPIPENSSKELQVESESTVQIDIVSTSDSDIDIPVEKEIETETNSTASRVESQPQSLETLLEECYLVYPDDSFLGDLTQAEMLLFNEEHDARLEAILKVSTPVIYDVDDV